MNTEPLLKLLEEYNKAPIEFQATRYWKNYENKIINEIKHLDIEELRSGKYPYFATFGFKETIYNYHPNENSLVKLLKKIIRKLFITNRYLLPYSLSIKDIREMAYMHCIEYGKISNAKPISDIGTSTFGKPDDLFRLEDKNFTMQFLNFYIRYCFVNGIINLKGDETIVELGSGSGHQVEILKKLYPDLTILCFDLPGPVYLCEEYMKNVLAPDSIVSTEETMQYKDLNNIKKGKVHFFGNWQFNLLKDFKFDIFWNAASFGEMEPDIVKNYLSYILGNCQWIYLLQARKGKESGKNIGVEKPTTFNDYDSMLLDYKLVKEQDAYEAHRKLAQSGGYFEAVWKFSK